MKDQRKTSIETTNRFSIFSPDKNPSDPIGKDSSLDDACERSIQIDDNHRTTPYQKTNKIPRKNKLPVTVILGDSKLEIV